MSTENNDARRVDLAEDVDAVAESALVKNGSEAPVEEPYDDRKINGRSILLIIALLTAAGFGLHSIQEVFTPIFLALTLVLALRPIGQFLVRHRVPSWLAATCTITVILLLIAGLLGITVWSLTPVPETLMNYSTNFEVTVNAVLTWLQERGYETQDLNTYIDRINFNSIISAAWGLLDRLMSFGGLLAIVAIAAFFLAIDTTITNSRTRIISAGHSNLGQALSGFEKRVRHYWIVSTVFGLIVAAIDGVILHSMGIPLAWTWAYWAYITNYIPNVGFVIGVVPPMLMGLLDQGWQAMVIVLIAYSLVNVVIQTFIQPKFTGDIVGLSPTVTFISLIVWTSVVGMLGSILAVPLTLFFKALLVDSDPGTRWLDVFLVSETEAERRRQDGLYDAEDPGVEEYPEISNPFSRQAQQLRHTRFRPPKLSALRRESRRASKE